MWVDFSIKRFQNHVEALPRDAMYTIVYCNLIRIRINYCVPVQFIQLEYSTCHPLLLYRAVSAETLTLLDEWREDNQSVT